MKVLVLANVGMWVYKLRNELIVKLLNTHEVYVSCIKDEYIDKIKELGCHYIESEYDKRGVNPFKDIKLLFRYIKMLRLVKPDIVLTYTIKPNIYGGIACFLNKVPYLLNVTGLGSSFRRNRILKVIVSTLYRSVMIRSKCTFFQNENDMNIFLNDDKKFYAKLIPGSGVNLTEYFPLPYPNDKIIRFVMISRIMKEKGVEEYLEAAKYISKKYNNIEFHICGTIEDEYRKEFSELVKTSIIVYHGLVDDIKTVLSEMHCTIHPSYHEGMSNVLLESAACSRPCIATNISGCREIVEDGINGFLIKVGDSQDLIEKIEKFINLRYEEKKIMGTLGRKKVVEEFDRKLVVDNYLEEIKRITCQKVL